MSEVRDQLSIDTPELVAIDFPVAGIGSRFVALLLDYLFQFAFLMLLSFFIYIMAKGAQTASAHIKSRSSADQATVEKWVEAIFILVPFLLQWGYFTLFEAFRNGQTPGKRIAKIRVIKDTGRPIGLFESMGRNLVRIVDMLPGVYAVGVITMFLNHRQQRLGDLVAGTLVVHERVAEAPMHGASGNRTFTAGAFEPANAHRSGREFHDFARNGGHGPPLGRRPARHGGLLRAASRHADGHAVAAGGAAGEEYSFKDADGAAARSERRDFPRRGGLRRAGTRPLALRRSMQSCEGRDGR